MCSDGWKMILEVWGYMNDYMKNFQNCSKYVEIPFVNDFKEDFKHVQYTYIDISNETWKFGI